MRASRKGRAGTNTVDAFHAHSNKFLDMSPTLENYKKKFTADTSQPDVLDLLFMAVRCCKPHLPCPLL